MVSRPQIGRRTLLIGAALTALAACGDDSSESATIERPRALSANEAELLALTRFRLHQAETVPVHMVWPGSQATNLDVTLDLHEGVAWGRLTASETDRLIIWNLQYIGTTPAGEGVPGLEEWSVRSLTTDVPQDIFMMLALSLGSDRPENPVLLQQSSAQFIRRDQVDGVEVSVLTGPRPAEETDAKASRSRYWIDDEGALRRFEAYLGDPSGDLATLTIVDPHEEVDGLREQVPLVFRGRTR